MYLVSLFLPSLEGPHPGHLLEGGRGGGVGGPNVHTCKGGNFTLSKKNKKTACQPLKSAQLLIKKLSSFSILIGILQCIRLCGIESLTCWLYRLYRKLKSLLYWWFNFANNFKNLQCKVFFCTICVVIFIPFTKII